MLARVYSCAVIGLDGVIVEVEVDTSQGLPGMDIAGTPDLCIWLRKRCIRLMLLRDEIQFYLSSFL